MNPCTRDKWSDDETESDDPLDREPELTARCHETALPLPFEIGNSGNLVPESTLNCPERKGNWWTRMKEFALGGAPSAIEPNWVLTNSNKSPPTPVGGSGS